MYIISLCNRTEAWAGHGFANLGQEVRNGPPKSGDWNVVRNKSLWEGRTFQERRLHAQAHREGTALGTAQGWCCWSA